MSATVPSPNTDYSETEESVQGSLRSHMDQVVRRKRQILPLEDPILWPNQRIPFVFAEPFRKYPVRPCLVYQLSLTKICDS